MDIKISHNIPLKYTNQTSTNTSFPIKDVNYDEFVSSKSKFSNSSVSFSGKNIFSSLFKTSQKQQNDDSKSNAPDEFSADISNGIKKVMDCDIPPENFSFVMTPDEFRKHLPELKEENFISTEKNLEAGIYNADLDYQSTFSSGIENVFDILDNAAEYADKYYEKTGKEFIFAVTDRDSIEGLQHLLRVAGSDPEKYKHLKIIPGIKMSFAHEAPNSAIGYENSDMLIYGINPFSENIIDFIDTTISKRKDMMVNFIKEVNQLYPEFSYNVLEFAQQNRIKYKKNFGVPNLYWRAREYAETKGDTEIKGISMVPADIIKEAQSILDDLDKVFLGSEQKGFSAFDSQIIKDNEVNKSIKKVFDKYSTHYDEDKGKAVSSAENLYKDMIECLSKENEKPVLALASPYYFSHYYEEQNSETFDKVVEFFNKLKGNSNEMLLAFESISPFYDLDKYLKPESVEKFNNYIRKNTDLYEVGGSFAKRAEFL